jgi:hypothetical protein
MTDPFSQLDAQIEDLRGNPEGPLFCPRCKEKRKAASAASQGWSLLWCPSDHYWYVTTVRFNL